MPHNPTRMSDDEPEYIGPPPFAWKELNPSAEELFDA